MIFNSQGLSSFFWNIFKAKMLVLKKNFLKNPFFDRFLVCPKISKLGSNPIRQHHFYAFKKELFSKSVNLERFWQVSWFTSNFFSFAIFFSSYNSYFSWQLTYWSVRTWMLFFHSIPDTGGQHVQNNHFQKSTILLVQYWRKK